jgi:tetratricopeptide (TPR) repeat protein
MLNFTKEANAHARRLFDEAIELAPEYSRAHSAISRTHNLDWRYSWSAAPDESLEIAIDFARRAKQLDPLDARGFAELGYAKLYRKQLEEALVEYARVMALNPNDSDIITEYADALVYAEQPAKSVELLEKAMRLNPFYPDWYLWLCHAKVAQFGMRAKMANDDFVRPPPVSACDHSARGLALCAFHAQLSRHRRSAGRARSGCLLRNGAAMGFEVRAVVRPRTPQSTFAANGAVAS